MNKEERKRLCGKLMSNVLMKQQELQLIDRLDQIGFFDAPASTKWHGNYEGGLFDHSYAVTESLLELTDKLGLKWKNERSPYVVGMFHDLCKCGQYDFDGDTIVYNKNSLLSGHGDKSVIIAQRIIPLTDEEILCIRWHMGAFDDKENWNYYGNSIEQCPNVLWTHTADMMAARIKKV
jgi:hypothetical protein